MITTYPFSRHVRALDSLNHFTETKTVFLFLLFFFIVSGLHAMPLNLTTHCKVSKKIDGGYCLVNSSNQKLLFFFDEEYVSGFGSLSYKIYQRPSNVIESNSLTKVTGGALYEISCSSLSSGFYTLEVINEKNEKFFLRFKK